MKSYSILCPTDFSECSLNAIEYAAKLGEKYHAEMVLFHVPNKDDYQKLMSNESASSDPLSFAKMKIDNLVKEVEKESLPKGLKSCKAVIHEGKTVKSVLEYAKSMDASIIIMGTEGVNEFKKNYIGTRSSRVIQKSDRDVLIVPRKVYFKPPKKFVYATDYLEEDKIGIKKVVCMAGHFDCEIDMVHVSTKKKAIDKALHQTMISEIKPFVKYEKVNYVLKSYRDEPGLGLENYMITAKADILVTLSKKKSWFDQLFTQNLSRKMSYFINKPLWVIKSLDTK
ncbi:universal stress protein [Pararhodonellum marinum]|uniref:universal stress protein n=1 Tax=Pararhodonellum marinum TaxID=2755358 RepID=UPI00188EC96E|nr:universal stress protein [Pararhodonellum marinum]